MRPKDSLRLVQSIPVGDASPSTVAERAVVSQLQVLHKQDVTLGNTCSLPEQRERVVRGMVQDGVEYHSIVRRISLVWQPPSVEDAKSSTHFALVVHSCILVLARRENLVGPNLDAVPLLEIGARGAASCAHIKNLGTLVKVTHRSSEAFKGALPC